MKLLVLTQSLDRRDAVLGFFPRWIEALARRTERVRVIALRVGDTSGLPANVDWVAIGERGTVRRWWRLRRALDAALARDGFDTVLAHMVPRYALLAAGPARRAKAGLYLWYTHAAVDARLQRALNVVDKVFTASPESLRVDTNRAVVTGHGIDLDHFGNHGAASQKRARLVSVGRLTPSKDPLTVIEAVRLLAARGREVDLELVGGGRTVGDVAYEERVRAAVRAAGLEKRVSLSGAVPYTEIADCYERASVVVNASHTGSLDKVVLEAMASGRIVVSCNPAALAVLRGVAQDALALAFEPGDASGLAERIAALLDLPDQARAELGRSLRAIVARDHEVERLADRLVREMGVREMGGAS